MSNSQAFVEQHGPLRTIVESERALRQIPRFDGTEFAFSARSLRSPDVIVIHAPTHSHWAGSVWARVAELSALTRDWDSYGALPLQLPAVEALQATLEGVAENVNRVPLVSLTTDGGLLCEWLGSNQTLALSISGLGDIRVQHEDGTSGTEWEGPLAEVVDMNKKVWHSSL